MTLRVVADTNIYISALHFGGVAEEVVALGRQRQIRLYVSSPILKELEGVLVQKFTWSVEEARHARRVIQEFAEMVSPNEKVTVFKRNNEPDNRILECAVAAEAQYVVSGDHAVQALQAFRAIKILSPREFLDSRTWLKA